MVHLLLLSLLIGGVPEPPAGFPRPEEFAREVRRAITAGFESQQDFTYRERRRDIDISPFGGVTIGPLRTFEVYPSAEPRGAYKRLIEIDGQPLTEAELAQRDAEHERDLRQAAARARRESPRQRAAREKAEADERRKAQAILDDAVAVFEPVFVGRESIEGHPVFVVDLRPRQDAQPATREGRWMQHFVGRVWVAETDYQIVRLDMQAARDVTIGWGVIGRIDEGSRMQFSRRRFEDVWVPAELTYEASGRTLMVRAFRFAVTTTYSDYQRRNNRDPRAAPPNPGARQTESTGGADRP